MAGYERSLVIEANFFISTLLYVAEFDKVILR